MALVFLAFFLPKVREATGSGRWSAWGDFFLPVGGATALVAPMVRLLATSILEAIRLFPRVVSLDMREEYHKKMLTQVYRRCSPYEPSPCRWGPTA